MYEIIQHQRLESAASTITLSDIPQIYTDLFLTFSLRSNTTGNTEFYLKLNNTNPTQRHLRGNGSSTLSNTDTFLIAPATGQTASTFGNGQIYIPNYTSNTTKSAGVDNVTENNASTAFQSIYSSLYDVTTGVTSIQITDIYGQWIAGSSATLYGVARKSSISKAPQATGGYINYANGYWYHTFTGSGTFVPFNNMQVEYVVVAGGGGSGGGTSGGGGAGGYRSSVQGERSGGGASAESRLSVTANTNYAVVVGAGGSAGLTDGSNGGAGSASSFSTITTVGGGGGDHAGTSQSGGSGGGAGYGTRTAGAATSGQGYPGGNTIGTVNPYYTCGGGGGAGAPGGAVVNSYVGGFGGDGVETSITGTATYLAGGGAGGTGSGTVRGGLGGGGSSTDNQNGVAGTANTGGGAGGPGTNAANSGAAGGSGIVIIRYPGYNYEPITYAESSRQYSIDPATIQGAWTFESSENSTYGGHTTTDYGNVGSIQSGTRKWTEYAGALQTSRVDANDSGMRISAATNWTMAPEQTIELWVNPISGGRLDALFTWGNRQDNVCTILQRNASTGQLSVRTNSATAATSGYVLDSQWSWVVVSKRGSELKVFVNGNQVYFNANGDGGGYTSDGRYFTLGADFDSGYTDAPRFSGAAYWQDVIAYRSAPFHSMNSIPVPTMPLTLRIV